MPIPEEIIAKNLYQKADGTWHMRHTNHALLYAADGTNVGRERVKLGSLLSPDLFYTADGPDVVREYFGVKTKKDRQNLIKAAQIQGGAMIGVESSVKIVQDILLTKTKK